LRDARLAILNALHPHHDAPGSDLGATPGRPRRALSADGVLWRRLAYAGARYGPTAWVRLSPPVIGVLFALLMRDERRAVRAHLRRVFGPRRAWREGVDVARTFANYASCLAEALASERPEAARARRRVYGRQHLERALVQGRGVVLVTAHTGAWDVGTRLLAHDFQSEVSVVMLRESDEAARRLHDAIREQSGISVVHVGAHPLDALPLVKRLARGGIVAVQLDRAAPNARSLDVRLFGEPWQVPEGPFSLAARAGAPVLPLFVRRAGYFDYEFWASEPIVLPRRPTEAELRCAAERAAAEMERFILKNPTQWFLFEGAGNGSRL
jgi:lauroyl/myristoyl acyltransferase